MGSLQYLILLAALPVGILLIVTTIVALRAVIKAQDDRNDPTVGREGRAY